MVTMIVAHVLAAAAFIGDQKLVEPLLSSGGKPNTASNLFDMPLQAAATNGQIEIVQIPTEEWRRNQSFFQISPFLLKGPYQRSGASMPYIVLQSAAEGGHKSVVRFFCAPEHGLAQIGQRIRNVSTCCGNSGARRS